MLKLNIVWLSICTIAALIGNVYLLVLVVLLSIFFVNRKTHFLILLLPLVILGVTRYLDYQSYLANKPSLAYIGEVLDVRVNSFQQVVTVGFSQQKILANIAKYPSVILGSKVKINGELKPLDIQDTFQKNSIVNGISWEVDDAEVEIIEPGSRKIDYCYLLTPIYAYELGQFLCGITIGEYQLQEDHESLFKNLGITHVLSVSGYNVTLVMGLLLRFSGLINRKKLYWFVPLILFGYLQIVGSNNIPAARAVIMAIVTIIATATGRPAAIWLAILYTNLIFFCVNPLVYLSISWQLSLSALLGILLLTEPMTSFLKFVPSFIRGELAVSLAASLATAPVLLLNFGELSWISPVANLIILPLIPYGMLLAGVILVFGSIEPLRVILFFWSEIVWKVLLLLLELINSYKLAAIVLFFLFITCSYAYFKYTQKAK